ncbi:MAG: EAL domain-containing response regulator [Candidatus Polarisedimenticolia bacterium]
MDTSNSGRPVEILLVEDNPGDTRLASEALGQGRYRAHLHTAADGVEAMAYLRLGGGPADIHRPDLIFLDLNLPRKTGREVLSEIKGHPDLRRIPVVILSSSADEQAVTDCYSLHANCFIQKPADWTEYARRLNAAVEFWLGCASLATVAGGAAERLRTLLIAGRGKEARLVRARLEAAERPSIEVVHVHGMEDALQYLACERFDAVLLDLDPTVLPQGTSLRPLAEMADGSPLVVLCDEAEQERAVEMLREGADDYQVRGVAGDQRLERALRHTVSRARWRLDEERHARRDPLTGLPNRSALLLRLRHLMEQALRTGCPLGVIHADLDRFKAVNDQHGPEFGDMLLQVMGERLRTVAPAGTVVARLGGDDFVVILPAGGGADGAPVLAAALLDALRAPVTLGAVRLAATASLGVALYPDGARTPEELLFRALTAMNRAKKAGRDRFILDAPDVAVRLSDEGRLALELVRALRNDEFCLHYQPIADGTGRIIAVEALLRWRHPSRGLLAAGHFIAAAEAGGLIQEIGGWALHAACAQARAWREAGLPPLGMAVNFSVRQLEERPGLLERLDAALESSGIAPALLEVQITEDAALRDEKRVADILKGLRDRGVGTSIDNFGTGYLSLSSLKRLPIDGVRIDRSFVHGVTYSPGDAAIVRSIIAMAHGLRMRVVALGVETDGQAAFLRAHAADRMQGYFVGRPGPPEECALRFATEARRMQA